MNIDDPNLDRSKEAISSAARAAGEAAGEAANKASRGADEAAACIGDLQAVVAERTRECMEATDIYVQENPWRAVGLAAGIGFVLGVLISRR
jgi:ElaB/YqjD/DUF883 family membrane-anchored ribosome-binding protein